MRWSKLKAKKSWDSQKHTCPYQQTSDYRGRFFFESGNQDKGKEFTRLLDKESHLEQTIKPTLAPYFREHFKLNPNLYQSCNGLLFSCISLKPSERTICNTGGLNLTLTPSHFYLVQVAFKILTF